jgi:hypothetical protein
LRVADVSSLSDLLVVAISLSLELGYTFHLPARRRGLTTDAARGRA